METVATLAHLSRFVIADITDARTVLQELQGLVPAAPTLPVQPILLSGQKEPGMLLTQERLVNWGASRLFQAVGTCRWRSVTIARGGAKAAGAG